MPVSIIVAGSLAWAAEAFAQAVNAPGASVVASGAVTEIRVEGSERIEPATIRSYLKLEPGQPFDPDRMDQSLKDLFATGLFADVVLRREDGTLVVKVTENPIINRIAFEGNRHLKEDQLQTELQLRPRVVYTRTRVQNDVQRILDLYRRTGRFAATVEPKIIKLDQNRVDLVFEIEEGSRTEVRRINFVGNEKFSRGDLQEVLQTKESHWYRFMSNDDNYDPDRLNYDKDLLRRHYLRKGYADFRVISAVAELTPEKDAFYITFTLDEGERYKFGKVDLTTNLKGLDPETQRENIDFEPQDWYNADLVETAITKLTDSLGNLQKYPFVDVRPRINRNREERTIDITFELNEGQRLYVERIDVTGNVRTLDRVVRRELLLAEGDPFNQAKIKRSEERIKDLNFFEKVSITNTDGTQADQTVVQVDVTEKSTGEISLGAGFSTTDGALGDFSISEHNLLGTGRELRFGATISQRRQEYDLSFTEPYFLNRDLSAGIDLFRVERNNQLYSSYNESNTGFALRFGYPLAEHVRQRVSYSLTSTTVGGIPIAASPYIREQAGTRMLSQVSQEVAYDTRNSRLDPSHGVLLRLSNDFAGAGGTEHFVRTRIGATGYKPMPGTEKWIGSLSGEVGQVSGLNQKVAISDRFFLGGDTLRGFRVAGIGPRDIKTSDALGGTQFYRASVELRFPLGLPDELGFSGHIFTDAGSLNRAPVQGPDVRDSAKIRAASGTGLLWRSPMGPVGVDIAMPIAKERYDKLEQFRFNFGTRF